MAKKGQIFKKYSPEFKLSVILDMREHQLQKLHEYINYYNNERISLKLKMSPVKYRTQFQYI